MPEHTDGDDPRLADRLLRWEELHEQGQSLSAELFDRSFPADPFAPGVSARRERE